MAEKTSKTASGEAEVLDKIATFPTPYRAMGERLHAVILESAPALKPRIWYGMPGYAKGAGPVLVFFRFDGAYLTLGLSEKAHHAVADGAPDQLMASAWFLSALDTATEASIAAIVRKAIP